MVTAVSVWEYLIQKVDSGRHSHVTNICSPNAIWHMLFSSWEGEAGSWRSKDWDMDYTLWRCVLSTSILSFGVSEIHGLILEWQKYSYVWSYRDAIKFWREGRQMSRLSFWNDTNFGCQLFGVIHIKCGVTRMYLHFEWQTFSFWWVMSFAPVRTG